LQPNSGGTMLTIYFRTLVISLLINALTFAQAQQPTPAQLKAQAELEKKSFALLEEVLADSANLKLPENKLYVNFMLVDLLWKKDEKRARALYKKSNLLFAEYTKTLKLNDHDYSQTFERFQRLREEVIQQLVPRDIALAQEFLLTTKLQNPNGNESQYEINLAGSLANQVAQRDPQKALKLAKESLASGSISPATNCLVALQTEDMPKAVELAQEIFQKLRTITWKNDDDPFQAAMSLFIMVKQQNIDRSESPGLKITSLLNQSDYKELAELILTYGLKIVAEDNQGSKSYLTTNIFSNLDAFEKLVPSKAAEIITKTNYIRPAKSVPDNFYQEFNQFTQRASVPEILAAGKTARGHLQNSYFEQAASKAYQQGNPDLAERILTENFPNQLERKSLLENFAVALASRLEGEEKLEEAYQAIQKIKQNENKFNALISLFSYYRENRNIHQARLILDEAFALIDKELNTRNQLNQTFMVVSRYLEIDIKQGEQLLSLINNRINEITPALIIADKFEGKNISRSGEICFQDESTAVRLLFDYNSVIVPLAKKDFEQAKSLTEQFQRVDLRLVAKLTLLRGLLNQYSHN
jgi:hypothetical protein